MVIEALDGNVIARIRSSSTIDSVTQCVTELVLNSLDAKSTAIAVRVDVSNFKIQVVDNGKGISRENMEFLGRRYMTNKCHDLSDLQKRCKFYGFKGEALASIAEISHRVSVVSRAENCNETYSKTLEGETSAIEPAKTRPSCGTTVTVEGFLSCLPVRQQCIKNTEIDNVKRSLEALIIIHPRVSFTLRNDATGKIILDSVKCSDVASSFKNVHPEVDDDGFVLFRVSKNKTSVEGLIHKDFHENKRLQYVYVNKRPISCPKIQTLISSNLKKVKPSEPKKVHPVYVLHIKCPYSDIDLNLQPAKTVVFFKKFDVVRKCIEKMIGAFLGDGNAQNGGEKADEKSEFGMSRIEGAVTGVGTKRRGDESGDTPCKSPKIVEEQTVEMKKRSEDDEEREMMDFDVVKENSMFTNFPDNEQKGKDIIMDMFIKSVQVFPSGNKTLESLQPVEQSERFENESVKVRESEKVTLGVQTSQKNVKENMVSVGVQAGPSSVNLFEDFRDVSMFPRRSLTKFVSDYDFDFSKIDTFPAFNFNRKFASDVTNFEQTKTRKLFDFRNAQQTQKLDIFSDYDHHFIPYFDKGKENIDEIRSKPEHKMIVSKHSPKKIVTPVYKNSQDVCQSPYFVKKVQNKKNILSLKRSQEPYSSQHSKEGRENTPLATVTISEGKDHRKISHNSQKQSQMTCSKRTKRRRKLNESKISSYFTPQKKSVSTVQNVISKMNSSDQSKDLFPCTRSQEEKLCRSDEDIIITIEDEEERRKIMDRDVEYEKNVFPAPFSQSHVNKKTGIKTNKKDATFVMTERFEFVPKGLSPILKDYGPVESLSPGGKANLQNAVIQSYEDELLLVKWQNCMDDKDPKKFFEEIYEEKSKLIGSAIPNVALSKRETFENTSFSKQIFQNFEVIGQVDCKFIAVLEKTKNLVLLFDQHAVHERVRLEQLFESYKNSTIKIDQNIMIFLPQNELILIKNQKANLHSLGLSFDIFSDGIHICEVPLCIYNKFKKGGNLTFLIETLIKEIIETLRVNNGILVNTPKIIQNIINSEACRGAIKFGYLLTRSECFNHLKDLAECKLPFQCAHGRPTLTPLISIKRLHDLSLPKTRLDNLK